MRNQPQLITYVDRLATHLDGLEALLEGPLDGAFGGVHLLPFFYPIDGSDAGFDPIDHAQVDPRLGDWNELGRIGANRDLMADLIVNHVSALSPQYQDWAAKGEASTFDGMFCTFDSVFPGGATEAELLAIYRPRPGLCFSYKPVAGQTRLVWTTFTDNQIDVNVDHPATKDYFDTILDRFAEAGVNLIRLDAVGYAIKKRGTSCFMIPETFEFIDRLSRGCAERGMEMLVEIHSYYQTQIDIASRVDWVYDFALPPLVLDAFFRHSAEVLAHWLDIRYTNAVTVLDTHDGIGVIDVGRDQSDHSRPGLLTQTRIDALVEEIHLRSQGASRAATGAAANNLDLYQVNCTFYDALGRDDDLYLAARLIQMLIPGIPQVYYVGALAGENDLELLERTQVGRDINRHYYTDQEIRDALERPVVARLMKLLRWRNATTVCDGHFESSHSETGLRLQWVHGDDSVDCAISMVDGAFTMVLTEHGTTRTISDLSDL